LFRIVLFVLCASLTSGAFAQTGTVTGKITDNDTKEPLIGVTVLVDGTNKGEITNLDGDFTIKGVPVGERIIRITYVGYEETEQTVTITENQPVSIGTIDLKTTSIGLQEVEVFANVIEDRRTPIAVSTIGEMEIDEQLGGMALAEIMNSTPGVYATQGDGSYGDAYLNIRGFGQEEVLFMINGVPTNDMENGIMYWTNFAGLSEVTRNMQVQRGLGASKLAVNSVGGTVNIVTTPSDRKKGGNAGITFGNGSFSNRVQLTLNSGLMKSGWAITFQGSKTTAGDIFNNRDGYFSAANQGIREGTYVDAYSYFLTASKKLSENHTLLFSVFGAPANRGRAYNSNTAEYKKRGNYLYNSAMGYYNGQLLSVSQNYSHTPQATLMSAWNITDKLTLTTSAYASYATAYGTARNGAAEVLNTEGYQDFDKYEADNKANIQTVNNPYGMPYGTSVTGAQSTRYIEGRYNNHTWYGVISNINYQLDPTTSIVAGVDLRDYKATHYAKVEHLLGGEFVVDQFAGVDNNLLTPNRIAYKGDKVRYDYDGNVRWGSAFTQLEKSIDKFDIFISANVARVQMWRVGNMWSGDTDFINNSFGASDKRVFNNYNVKAGLNYRIDGRHNLFINGGTFSRAPYMRNVFVDSRYSNEFLAGLKNENIKSAEAGYSYRSGKFRANLNVYYTQWKDRILANEAFVDPRTEQRQALSGIAALHKGIEFDFRYSPINSLEFQGAFTKGDWRWTSDAVAAYHDDVTNAEVEYARVYTKGLKVGNTAQTTGFLGVHYKGIKDMYFGLRYNYFADLYESFNPEDRIQPGFKQVRKLPNYFILDAYAGYYLELGKMRSRFSVNVHNITNGKFIRRSDEAFGGQEQYGLPVNYSASYMLYFN
jgi:iron complex outermembrane receptor protein